MSLTWRVLQAASPVPLSAAVAVGLAVADQVAAAPRGRGRGRGGPGAGAAAGEGEGAAGNPFSKGLSTPHALIFSSRRHFVLHGRIENSKNCFEINPVWIFEVPAASEPAQTTTHTDGHRDSRRTY